MFKAALLVVAKIWKPSVSQLMNKWNVLCLQIEISDNNKREWFTCCNMNEL